MENERSISMKGFFIFMLFMGTLIGGFSILCRHHSNDVDLLKIPDYAAFLMGFVPVLLFALLVWLGNKRAGNGNRLPIR